MALQFSDGMTFDTSGSLRTEERSDGWYVVGNGLLIPVKDETEGKRILEEMKNKRK